MKELYTKPELALDEFKMVDVLTESETTTSSGIPSVGDDDED